MRWHDDDEPLDGRMSGVLLAIDAALDGEPSDPEFADLAELALILRAERPEPEPAFVRTMDERVQRRFVEVPGQAGGRARGWRRRWSPAAWGGGAVAVAAAIAVVVVLVAGRGDTLPLARSGAALPQAQHGAATSAAASSAASSSAAAASAPSLAAKKSAAGTVRAPAPSSAGSTGSASSMGSASSTAASGAFGAAAPTPAASPGRQIVQSAQLQLTASPGRIDDVAQEVFDVVASVNGIVDTSSVTSGNGAPAPGPIVTPPVPGGGAFFQLRVPSSDLSQALTQLSRLRYANVVSRTDSTQDITAQVGRAGMQLAEARALRRSLLNQLAAATTTEQVASLKLKLRDVDASIASRLSTLTGLKRQVAYSKIALTIYAATPVAKPSHGGGFTLGSAAHDAGRVLVVVAGVALIVLAALVPVALLAALGIWIGLALRRRRRDQALDAA